MKILLVGEYSRLHNSLKEGLEMLGHQVVLIGTSDGFKNFPVDYDYSERYTRHVIFRYPGRVFSKIFGYSLHSLERGIRFALLLRHFKGYNCVQFINETPIQTFAWLEKRLLLRLIRQNKKSFLLSCGADSVSVRFMYERKLRYSFLDPYFENPSLKKEYDYVLKYLKEPFVRLSEELYQNVSGVIATDFDYVLPLKDNPKFLGLIPNPVNEALLQDQKFKKQESIQIFLGINRLTYHKKGIPFFEKALEEIYQKYPDKVRIQIVENLPYSEYIKAYNQAHILLDQIYSYDQGYNALEAMAKGKVVFTGAEQEFLEYYGLKEDEVVINALPDVAYLVDKLSYLIENPQKIEDIGYEAQKFIAKNHSLIDISQKYIALWQIS